MVTKNANGGGYELIFVIRTPGKNFDRLRCGAANPDKKGDTGYLGGRRYLLEAGFSKLLLHLS
jgi:hypothetical protein